MSYTSGNSVEPVCGTCAQGDVVEFRSSSLLPWALFAGLLYVVFMTPEAHEPLRRTARDRTKRALARYRK